MLIEAKNTYQGLNHYCCNPDNEDVFQKFFFALQENIERIKQPLKNKVLLIIIEFDNNLNFSQKIRLTEPLLAKVMKFHFLMVKF